MERVMSELANHFAIRPDLSVHLVLYGRHREIFYPISSQIHVHKPSFEFNNRRRLLSTIKTMRYLRRTLNRILPDAILSFGEYWNNLVLISLLATGQNVFVSDRSQPNKSLGVVHDMLRRWLYPHARGVVAQTERAKEIFLRMYRHENIRVIGNPIRQISMSAVTNETRQNVVLMVARLISSKHQDRLIRLFLRINAPEWKLVLIGYDHLQQSHSQRLQNMVDEAKANDRIILAGKRDDVDKFYLSSKIFAFTSSSEGFPNAIGEALSAGLPVVAYDCDAGPSDLICHDVNGFLVPVFDDDAFQFHLERLMRDERLRVEMGNSALKSAERFERSTVGDKFLEFILEANA